MYKQFVSILNEFEPQSKHGRPPPPLSQPFSHTQAPGTPRSPPVQPLSLINDILRMLPITAIIYRLPSYSGLLYAKLHLFPLTPALEEIAELADLSVFEWVEVVDGGVDVLNRLGITRNNTETLQQNDKYRIHLPLQFPMN